MPPYVYLPLLCAFHWPPQSCSQLARFWTRISQPLMQPSMIQHASSWSSFDREGSKDEREMDIVVRRFRRHHDIRFVSWGYEGGTLRTKVKARAICNLNANVFINLNSRCRTKECHVVTVDVARGKLITPTDYIFWSLVACNQRTIYFFERFNF